jgi:hypothetical protein
MTDFNENLSRLIAAQLYLLLGMTAAREMFGKSFFALGAGERAAVDQAVLAVVWANFQTITPELLEAPKPPQQAGFGIPASEPTKE